MTTTMTIITTIHPGEGHPPASISPSILRLSAIERLAAAGVVIVLIWAAVFWAMAWKLSER